MGSVAFRHLNEKVENLEADNKKLTLEVIFLIEQLGKMEQYQNEAKINEIAKRHKIKRW